MAITNSTNYASVKDGLGVSVPIMQWATLDSDQFNRTHVADTAQTVEWHVHGGKAQGTGLSVLNLNSSASTNTALTNAGDVYITASHFTYMDGSAVAHTLAQLDGTNTYAAGAVQNFSVQTGANSLIVPTQAGSAPTTSGAIAYNSTNNTFVVGVNGTTQTLLSLGGGQVVSVANGGTGVSSWTNTNVLLFSGNTSSGAINSAFTAGSANTVLHSNGGGSYSWGQITGTDIASGTISGGNITNGSITSSQLSMTSIRASVVFNTPTTITNQFNVASITKNSTGVYTINFSTSIPSGCYALANVVSASVSANIAIVGNPTISAVQVFFANGSGNPVDPGAVSLIVVG